MNEEIYDLSLISKEEVQSCLGSRPSPITDKQKKSLQGVQEKKDKVASNQC